VTPPVPAPEPSGTPSRDASALSSWDDRSTPPVLESVGLSRWYGQVIGIQGISCRVDPGITGLLGLNGAGKSTLFKVMAGQLAPSKGTILLHGLELERHRGLYHKIGFCPEPDALYEFMTGREMLVYLLRLQGFSPGESEERAQRALVRCHLEDASDRKVAGYSKGMRQKIKLAQAMAHDPDVMFLDEPFNGMDPVSRHESMELVRELGAEGKTVLLSSHILHEVEAMTSTILLINNGKILAEGHISDIRDLIERHPHQIRIVCERPRDLASELIEGDDVMGIRVDSEHALVVESVLPRRFFQRLPEVALKGENRIRSYETLDDNLKSLFEYLVEDGS
jgi:ABC-2 type transport system ATP-binding protein